MTNPNLKTFLLDTRMAGRRRYILASEGELMQLPSDCQKCVVFVGRKTKGGFAPLGTAFLVAHRFFPDQAIGADYLVTARHVIEQVRKHEGALCVRLNVRGGQEQTTDLNLEDWSFHDDSRVDVAITPFPSGIPHDHSFVSTDSFATPVVIQTENIGVGNQLFFPGLFSGHYGEGRNEPIVRFGNIAGMPNSRVLTKHSGHMDVWLAEARSIGGLSGSPVFVNQNPVVSVAGPENRSVYRLFFLGLVHDHFNDGNVNTGVALIVPAHKVLEAFDATAIAEHRAAVIQEVSDEKQRISVSPD